jgi:hypothetical protein
MYTNFGYNAGMIKNFADKEKKKYITRFFPESFLRIFNE